MATHSGLENSMDREAWWAIQSMGSQKVRHDWATNTFTFFHILCSQRWRSSTQSAKTRPGADYGSDHELLIAKFRLKLKKVGKTTGPFRYDLNQILNDYTMGMMNRFKGLDLVNRVPEELWMEFVTLYTKRWPKPSQRRTIQKVLMTWTTKMVWSLTYSQISGVWNHVGLR